MITKLLHQLSESVQNPFPIAIIDKMDLTHFLGNCFRKAEIAQQIFSLEKLILRKQKWHSWFSWFRLRKPHMGYLASWRYRCSSSLCISYPFPSLKICCWMITAATCYNYGMNIWKLTRSQSEWLSLFVFSNLRFLISKRIRSIAVKSNLPEERLILYTLVRRVFSQKES